MQKNIVSMVNAAIAGEAPKNQREFNEHVAKMKETIDELKRENEEFSNTINEIRHENEELKKKIEDLTVAASKKASSGKGTKRKKRGKNE